MLCVCNMCNVAVCNVLVACSVLACPGGVGVPRESLDLFMPGWVSVALYGVQFTVLHIALLLSPGSSRAGRRRAEQRRQAQSDGEHQSHR